MKGQRIFGMIQPKSKANKKNEVYEVGCLGKITSFNETKDKRYYRFFWLSKVTKR